MTFLEAELFFVVRVERNKLRLLVYLVYLCCFFFCGIAFSASLQKVCHKKQISGAKRRLRETG